MQKPKREATWPEGWRPVKRRRGDWAIHNHQILYAMRTWNAFCWINPRDRKHVAASGSTGKQHTIDALVEHMRTCQPWKPYERYINNTGGNKIEDLLRGETRAGTNLPLFVIESCVASQVALLKELQQAGLLKMPPPPRPGRNR